MATYRHPLHLPRCIRYYYRSIITCGRAKNALHVYFQTIHLKVTFPSPIPPSQDFFSFSMFSVTKVNIDLRVCNIYTFIWFLYNNNIHLEKYRRLDWGEGCSWSLSRNDSDPVRFYEFSMYFQDLQFFRLIKHNWTLWDEGLCGRGFIEFLLILLFLLSFFDMLLWCSVCGCASGNMPTKWHLCVYTHNFIS